jgi:hypothetical protein
LSAACRNHVLHVGRAIFIRRRTRGDELHRAKVRGTLKIGGEVQAPGRHIALDHLLEARFVNRNAAVFQNLDHRNTRRR